MSPTFVVSRSHRWLSAVSGRVIDKRLDSAVEDRVACQGEIERAHPVEEGEPGTEHDRVHQESVFVDQAEPDKALRKRCAAVSEKVLARLALQSLDLRAQVAAEHSGIVPCNSALREWNPRLCVRVGGVLQCSGRFIGRTVRTGEDDFRNGVHWCSQRLGGGRPVAGHVRVRPSPDQMGSRLP